MKFSAWCLFLSLPTRHHRRDVVAVEVGAYSGPLFFGAVPRCSSPRANERERERERGRGGRGGGRTSDRVCRTCVGYNQVETIERLGRAVDKVGAGIFIAPR